MSIVGEVLRELFAMFFADAGLAAAILVLVAITGGLVAGLRVEPVLAGGVLLLGSLAILVGAAGRAAKAQARDD